MRAGAVEADEGSEFRGGLFMSPIRPVSHGVIVSEWGGSSDGREWNEERVV